MEDFASTALFDLISVELNRQGFSASTDQAFEGKIERSRKSDLLSDALQQLGPAAILRIGQGIHRISFNPTLAVLLKAAGTSDLIERWQRLEGYFHGNHRVRTIAQHEFSATLEHYALRGGGPSKGEDLVIAGLLAALLQQIGVKGLSLTIDGIAMISNDAVLDTRFGRSSTRMWQFEWIHFADETPSQVSRYGEKASLEQVRVLLASDLGRNWKLAAVANMLGTSPRSLQRKLAQSGTNFQTLLRVVRADGAATMILEQAYSLTEIGYAAGFSDQAHFSREFKLRFNMTPTDYLSLSQ